MCLYLKGFTVRTFTLFVGDENGLRDFKPEKRPRTSVSPKTLEFLKSMPELRRERGLSRRALAEKVGVSSEMIRALEVGRRKPSEKLEHLLRKTLSE